MFKIHCLLEHLLFWSNEKETHHFQLKVLQLMLLICCDVMICVSLFLQVQYDPEMKMCFKTDQNDTTVNCLTVSNVMGEEFNFSISTSVVTSGSPLHSNVATLQDASNCHLSVDFRNSSSISVVSDGQLCVFRLSDCWAFCTKWTFQRLFVPQRELQIKVCFFNVLEAVS